MSNDDDIVRQAERLYCEELWAITDENNTITKDGKVITVSREVMLVMRGIRLGVGWKSQKPSSPKGS